MSFIDHLNHCNTWNSQAFFPFYVNGERLGWTRHAVAELLACDFNSDFALINSAAPQLQWKSAPATFNDRTDAMTAISDALVTRQLLPALHSEYYPVTPNERGNAQFLIDRACAPLFGIRTFGQHINGFIRRDSELLLWIARRSPNRRNHPNLLDNTVAGGLPWGLSLRDNVRKECWEEATIPAALADQARPVGAITYCHATTTGLKPDVMYCYDLELPDEFVPQCNDDEVAEFLLCPIEQVIEYVRETQEFKLNCNLVLIDFFIRQGYINPDDPDYLNLITRLRSPLP
ncbi:NUDIX hydrolase [Thiospirillum jenense]|uniref:DUF4743 domain-containing protein n=1 Tax=Thiospirillum jenense TaxID=1653858 RepID=A0A839HM78_9GAMM|nr:DUF4743 domain-containing protein [Thiospirillum jenense]MBB1126672.1 DUF4743 domain-containing protein [Thiospirillum jenense]